MAGHPRGPRPSSTDVSVGRSGGQPASGGFGKWGRKEQTRESQLKIKKPDDSVPKLVRSEKKKGRTNRKKKQSPEKKRNREGSNRKTVWVRRRQRVTGSGCSVKKEERTSVGEDSREQLGRYGLPKPIPPKFAARTRRKEEHAAPSWIVLHLRKQSGEGFWDNKEETKAKQPEARVRAASQGKKAP